MANGEYPQDKSLKASIDAIVHTTEMMRMFNPCEIDIDCLNEHMDENLKSIWILCGQLDAGQREKKTNRRDMELVHQYMFGICCAAMQAWLGGARLCVTNEVPEWTKVGVE